MVAIRHQDHTVCLEYCAHTPVLHQDFTYLQVTFLCNSSLYLSNKIRSLEPSFPIDPTYTPQSITLSSETYHDFPYESITKPHLPHTMASKDNSGDILPKQINNPNIEASAWMELSTLPLTNSARHHV